MIAFDNSAQGDTSAATSLTYSHTNTAGNLLIVACGVPATDSITGVTYAGVSMTLIDKIASGAPDGRWCYLFYLLAPATGANNVVVSSSLPDFIYANSVSCTGVKQTGQPDSHNTAPAVNAASITASTTTVADDCWTFSTFRTNDSAFPTVTSSPSGATVRRTGDSAGAEYDSNGSVGAAGTKSITLTYGASRFMAGVIASFAPAVSSVNSSFFNFL